VFVLRVVYTKDKWAFYLIIPLNSRLGATEAAKLFDLAELSAPESFSIGKPGFLIRISNLPSAQQKPRTMPGL
jgi:hypothetical protein